MAQAVKMKTYVLEEHLAPTAPIYIRVSKGQRQRIDKIPKYRPYLTYTFSQKDGEQKTIRFKLNANTIDLHEQIAKNIPANAKFTITERTMLNFRNGVLMTNNKIAQEYLESTPHYNSFEGEHPTIKRPTYRLLDKGAEIVSTNKSFRANLAAANKIEGLSLKQAQDLLIKIYGTHYKTPQVNGEDGFNEDEALAACQNLLVAYMDSGDEAVAQINGESFSFDEEIKVLVGRLVSNKVISFTDLENNVARKINKEWVSIKEISWELSVDERIRQFSDFLSTKQGSNLLADLKNLESKK